MSFTDFDKFIHQNKNKKIFLLTGKNSYKKTGFQKHFEKKNKQKKVLIYFKKKKIT